MGSITRIPNIYMRVCVTIDAIIPWVTAFTATVTIAMMLTEPNPLLVGYVVVGGVSLSPGLVLPTLSPPSHP